jgi:hypothetical protein
MEVVEVETFLVIPHWTTQRWWLRLEKIMSNKVIVGNANEVFEEGELMMKRGTKPPPGEMMMVRVS